jgi:hypothetical protein
MRRSWALAVAMVVLTASVPVLSYLGFNAVLTSKAGRRLDAVNDPAKPNYEANVAPTPVELVAHVGADGALSGLTVLALGNGDTGGSVLFVPVHTVMGGAGADRAQTLSAAFVDGGAGALGRAVNVVLGFGFDELSVLDDARWAELVQPVAPLTVDSPDPVRTPAFAAGAIVVAADKVGPYLAARSVRESDLARLARHVAFWRAWLGAVGEASAPGAVPGETTAGVGRFVRGLAKGVVAIETLEVAVGEAPDTYVYDPVVGGPQLARLVPFPTGADSAPRVRLRVLDGVGVEGLAVSAAQQLVPAGAEVAVIGNADRFGYDTTSVRYTDEAQRPAAEAMVKALGLGAVEVVAVVEDVVDLTIVIGKDFAARYGSPRTTDTAGGVGAPDPRTDVTSESSGG